MLGIHGSSGDRSSALRTLERNSEILYTIWVLMFQLVLESDIRPVVLDSGVILVAIILMLPDA